jgi:hypothetical protein
MPDYLRFLLKPHRDPRDKALREAHLAAAAFLVAFVAFTAYRRTT